MQTVSFVEFLSSFELKIVFEIDQKLLILANLEKKYLFKNFSGKIWAENHQI